MARNERTLPLRRYYLLKRQALAERGERALESAYRFQHEAVEGTPLPQDFPFREILTRAWYSTVEDLTGATEHELTRAGLSIRDAERVLAALDAVLDEE